MPPRRPSVKMSKDRSAEAPERWSAPTRRPQPLILIRGFGGLGVEDEQRIAYQGFNDGTVYLPRLSSWR